MPDVETTRNTIFPAAWARRTDGPEELAAYYRERYTKDGLLGFNDNNRGTYFGRIVAYPRGKGHPGRSAKRDDPQASEELKPRAPRARGMRSTSTARRTTGAP